MIDGILLPRVVAFCGYAGCGKDTAADVLELFGYKRLAFADSLRRVAHELYDIPYEWMTDRKLKETPMRIPPYKSPREILQYLGTEAVRNFYGDTWVNKVRKVINDNPDQKYVITDWRFPNEGDFLEEIGALRTRITRAGVVRAHVHVSESYVDTMTVDCDLRNDGDKLYLFQKDVLDWAITWGH